MQQLDYNNGISLFYVIRAEMLYVRDKGTSVEICIGACKKRA
jgi:hypothetical protein